VEDEALGARAKTVGVEQEPAGDWRAWTSIGILMLITVLSNVDRSVIAYMVDPIKRDLHVDDFQISLLQGFAFVLFYASAAVPMGWLGDRFPRRWVMFWGVTAWSVATAVCGLARNYWHLFVARMGVGLGEATLAPTSYAIAADLFPARRLGLAIGVLAAGAAIGNSAAAVISGLVVEWAQQAGGWGGLAPWQVVFVIVGLPGLAMAPLVLLIPAHRPAAQKRVAPETQAPGASMADYVAWLRQRWRYVASMALGVSFHAVFAYGLAAWTPAYLSRHYGLSPAEIGGSLALVSALTGIAGFVGGGWFVDWMRARNVPDPHFLYFIVNCALIGVIGVSTFTLVKSVPLFLVLQGFLYFLMPFTGPAMAHLQESTPRRFRGRTVAIFMLAMNLIGMMIGPSSVALFSQYLFGGPEHVGLGLAMTFLIFAPISIVFFLLARAPARAALAAAGE
jgi:MFS family permease